MNASDAIGQYTSAAGFTINWTQGTINNNQPSVNALGMNLSDGIAIDYSGHRMFTADPNNNRVLVYNLNANNILVDKTPDFVLGQSSFTTNTAATTATGMKSPYGVIFDANNNRLFVAEYFNNRVSVFDVATITNGEAAVNVLGQSSFTTSTAATSATGMTGPDHLALDAANNRLFVTEWNNNRVLVFDVAAITNGEAAVNVLGQSSFTTSAAATTATGMRNPLGIAYDGTNNRLFVTDYTNNRVLVFDVTAITNGEAAVNVLGQSSFTTSTAATTQTGMQTPGSANYDATNNRLFITEWNNNRVLVFDVAAINNGEAAVNVLGQSLFTTSTAATTQSGLKNPDNLFYDGTNGLLYVSDASNNRIVVFNAAPQIIVTGTVTNVTSCATPNSGAITLTVSGGIAPYTYNWGGGITTQNRTGLAAGTYTVTVTDAASSTTTESFTVAYPVTITNGMNASDLIGQYTTAAGFTPNWTQGTINNNQASTNALGFSNPRKVLVDEVDHRMFVADIANHRVLVYNLDANNNLVDKTPDFVLGQTNFTSATAATTQTGMNGPNDLAYDVQNKRLFVAEQTNNRVTVFDVATITNGEAAINVLGQANFTTSTAATTQAGMNGLTAIAYDDVNQRLFVAEATNQRVTVFDVATITNGENAINVLGQANFTSNTAAVTQAGLQGPIALAYDPTNQRLFVNQLGANRISVFNVSTITNGQPAVNVLGQPNFTTSTAATTQAGLSAPYGSDYYNNILFVTDAGNNRVLTYDVSAITNGENASNVLGQPNFTTGTATTTQAGLNNSRRLFYHAATGKLYVPDNGNNRVVVYYVGCPLSVTGTVTNVTCNGGSTGAITLTVSGGLSPYTYNWGGGITTQNRTGLTAGTYTVTVTDATSNTATATFTITQPAALTVTGTQVNIACFGASTGSINITAVGGTGAYTYNWGGGVTTEDRTGLAAGTYTVTVTDANSCTSTASFTITQPASALSVTGTQVNVACFGGATGSINITATGGTGAYTYNWGGGVTTEDRTGLAAGTYTVTVTDANSCTTTASFTITQPASALSVTGTQVNVACFGGATGSINITATGGTGTTTYNWGGGVTTEDRTGLAAGAYTVTVTDANLCTATASFTITQPAAALSVTGTQVNVACFGAATGSINITAMGGTTPYTYNWGGGITSEDRTGLAAGTYTVTVTDFNSCTKTASFTITQPGSALILSPAVTQPTCFGFGSIALTPNGGTGPYTFDWADITGTNNPQHRTGLSAGTYSVTLTDFNGCTVALGGLILNPPTGCAATTVCQNNTASVFYVTPDPSNTSYNWTVPAGAIIVSGQGTPQVIINWSGVAPGTRQVCVTAMNVCGTSAQTCQDVDVVAPPTPGASVGLACAGGIIQLSATGGSTYLWSGPNGFSSSSANPTILNANAATHNGVYTVTVTNTAGCSSTAVVSVNVRNTPQLSASTTNATCGQSNGTIDLSVTGGTPGYTYIWTNSAVTQDLSNLSAATYRVTVTDAVGCTQTISAAVSNTVPGPVVTVVPTNPACFGGSNGSINATISGGVPPLTIQWSNGASTEDISGLAANTYNISVTDANGCTVVATTTVGQPSAITLDEVQTNVNCFGASTGSIDLSVSGGTGAYSYSWTKNGSAFGGNTQDLSALGAGVYAVTVTDANSCTATLSITITQPAAALSATSTVSNVSCNGGANGQVILTVTGGTLPYSYSWTGPGGFASTNRDITNRAAGAYNVTITDHNGCTFPLTGINITQPPLLNVASAVPVAVKCFGGSDGSINVTITGGTGSYAYAWSNGVTTEDPTGLSTGTYTVTVTDANGCTAVSAPITVGQPAAPLVATPTASNVTCFGLSTGSISLAVTGGTTTYSYLWSNAAITQNLTAVPAGTYAVTVTDANLCTAVASATVGSPAALVLSGVVTDVLCNGAATGAINLSVTGGTGAYSYSWTGGAVTEDRTGLTAGNYTVTVTDGNSCQSTKSFSVRQTAALSLSMVNTNISCNGGSDGAIDLSVSGGLAPYTYQWSNSAVTQDISGLSANVYTVTVTDANSCTAVMASSQISQPAVLTVAANLVNNVTCKGGANGSATAVPTGGTTTYNYQWSNGSMVQTPNNFTAGTFTVTVTDSKGCTATGTVTITEPATAIELSANPTFASACGGNTGTIDLMVQNGVSPFSYLWTGPTTIGNIQDPSGLAAGTYTVTVSDAAGCSSTLTVNVLTAPALTASVLAVNTTCQGADGQAFASVTGGLAPYTYSWAPGGATSSSLTGLTPGTYTVTVTDVDNCTTTASGTISTPTNCQPPTAVNDSYYTLPAAPVSGTVASNDSDPDNTLAELTFLPTGFPSTDQGTIEWDSTYNGNFTFTPAPGFYGVVAIPYQVCDPTNLCATAILYITVNNTFAQNDINQTPINVPVSGNVLVNDSDPQGNAQTVTSAQADTDGDGQVDDNLPLAASTTIYGTNNANMVVVAGTITLNANGTYTYTPAPNFTGDVPLSYMVTDNSPSPASDNATVRIKVVPTAVIGVNEPPVANDDTNTTEKDVTVSGNVLPNDHDPDGDAITVTNALADTDGNGLADNSLQVSVPVSVYGTDLTGNQVLAGVITLNPNGSYTFDPSATFVGEVTIPYTISDPGMLTDNAVLTITVTNNLGNATFANDDANVGPQNAVQTGNILTNDGDPEGNTQTVTAALNSSNAPLVVNGSTANVLPSGGTLVLAANGAYTYTPAANFTGTEIVRYTASDNGSPVATDVAVLYLTTLPINNTYAQNDVNATPINTQAAGNVLTNDSDAQGNAQTVTSARADTDGDGQVDDNLPLGTATPVYGLNSANMLVLAGQVTLNSDGSYVYVPTTGFTGDVPFAYTITDNNISPATDNATVSIKVIPAPVTATNDPPLAQNDTKTTERDANVGGNVMDNDRDPDGDVITVTAALVDTDGDGLVDEPLTLGTPTSVYGRNLEGTTVLAGNLTLNSNGTFTFDPTPTFLGTVLADYTISDPGGLTDVANLTIRVTENEGNVTYANDDVNTGLLNVVQTGNVLTNDTDPEGNTQTVTAAANSNNIAITIGVTVALPSGGQFILNANGTYTYTPATGFVGTERIIYTISDNGSPVAMDRATLYLTTLPLIISNNPPVANNDSGTTPEDTPITVNILANDTDPENNINPASVTIITPPANGTVTVNPVTGQVTYTPNANFNGVNTFTYSVCDLGSPIYCDDAVVTITVTPVNDPPVAVNDAATTPEDTPVTFPVTANDTDVDGAINPATLDLDPMTTGVQTTFTVAGQGTFVANPVNGNVTFTPVANFNGATTPITYGVCDNGTPLPALCATATITVTVTPVNDPPVAVNDAATTPEDTPVTFPVTANDTDVDGTINPATLDLDPATTGVQTTFTVAGQGTFVANPVNGNVTFTPVANFNGTTTPITYGVCDNGTPLPAQCATATITVTVTPVNDPPVAVNDAATTPEDTPVTFPVTANDTDVDGTINPATLDLDPTTTGVQTTFTVAGQGTFVANPVNGNVTFTPVANFNGATTPITYSVCDNGTPLPAQCATATITVTVTPVNDPPVAVNDAATTPEDTPVSIGVLLNDSDVDGVLIPATVDLDPATPGIQTTFTVAGQGTYTVNPVNGVVLFTPVTNFNGTTTPVTYSVCDDGTPLPSLCSTATITITITPANDPPVAVNDAATTPEDTPVTFPVTANDTDVDGSIDPATLDLDPGTSGVQTTFTVAGQGTFVANPANGNVTFTPVANFNGTTTPITYSVCDNGSPLPALCATATITVTVTPVNDPPVAVNDAATTPEDTPVNIAILLNDSDVDGALLPGTIDLDPATSGIQTTFTVAGQGTYSVNPATGIVTFTPVLNYNGTATPITYSVCDNGIPLPSLCATATITVMVTPVNDPPVAVNDLSTTPEDTPVTFSVTGNDTDVDGAIDLATLDLDPTTSGIQTTFTVVGQGTFVANPANGNVTFTPVANYNGTTTPITYGICDNGTPLPALCATATITVVVTPVNDPPVAVNDAATTPEDTPVTFSVTGNDTDVDGSINPATLDLDPATAGVQTAFTVAGQGTFVANPATGTVTFTPVTNYNGTTTPITYSVCDNGTPLPALCATATITVTVIPVNDPPVAVNDAATTPEDTPITFNPLTNDTDVDGSINPATLDLDPATAGIQTTFTIAGQGTYVANPVTGAVTFTPVTNYSGTATPITYSVCDNGTPLPALCAQAAITITVTPDPNAKLQVKVLLQGALFGNSNTDTLMRDNLRSGGYIPLTEPYTAFANARFVHRGGGGGETTTAAVLAANAGTPNAIVDWVFVELRSASDSSNVLYTRSALIQRDGDVVNASDGVSKLTFPGIVGQQYFVSVKHRNHLGVMTAGKVVMNNDSTLVDFIHATNAQVYDRPGSTNYNGMEQVTVQNNRRALWAGNANMNTKVKYQGTASDNSILLAQVLAYPGNTLSAYNYNLAFGYYNGDINMDGKVKYQGPTNDATFIFTNVVGLYTLNTAALYNYDLFLEQTPN